MTKHKHLFFDYSDQHKGEKVTIDDESPLLVFGCSTFVIDNANYEDVLQVSRVGLNLISIYNNTHTNKKWNLG
jgi:hypothetical protein